MKGPGSAGPFALGFRFSPSRAGSEASRSKTVVVGMRIFVAGKLVQRSWQDNDGNKRQTVEIQVTHVGPDLQFATAEVVKSTAEGSGSGSDTTSSADQKQSA